MAIAVLGVAGWIVAPVLSPSREPSPQAAPLAESATEGPAEVQAIVVRARPFVETARASGRTAGSRTVEIMATAAGPILDLGVQEGSYVGAGEVLFRIDPREAELELRHAQGALLAAQARYAGEEALAPPPTPRQQDEMAEARAAYEATLAAAEQGALSPQEVDRARRRFEAAQLLAGEAASDVRAARTGLWEAEVRVAQARLALERTVVRAPYGARVSELTGGEGQYVAPGAPVLRLVDLTPLYVEVEALESTVATVSVGTAATVRVPALERTFRGRVRSVNPALDPQTRALRLVVEVQNAPGAVAGLYCEVEFDVASTPDALAVPEEAVLIRDGRPLAFVLREGRAAWTYVEVGPRSDGRIVVREGLAPGDTVAVGGHAGLAHGAAVRAVLTAPLDSD